MAKVIVIGGGPAGIMAAITAAKNNEVILIERNNEIGKKLKLTGGGRCNITNNRDIEEFFSKIVTNNKFLYSALYTFSNYQLLEYLSEKGLEYKVEYDEKVYTKSDKADEVISLFENELRENNVKILYNTKVEDLIVKDNVVKGVILDTGKSINGDKVIVTTGGKSFPTTGSDGSMYEVIKKYGHTITPIYPALIPLVIKEEFVKNLQGIAMKDVHIQAKFKKKKFEKEGDMIFTHFGISGPAVLKISSYLNKYMYFTNSFPKYLYCILQIIFLSIFALHLLHIDSLYNLPHIPHVVGKTCCNIFSIKILLLILPPRNNKFYINIFRHKYLFSFNCRIFFKFAFTIINLAAVIIQPHNS